VKHGSKSYLFSLVAVFIVSLSIAEAIPTEWRTEVQGSVRTGGSTQIRQAGGLNESPTSLTFSLPGGSAVASASSALASEGFVPTLRAVATNNGSSAQAVAWGVQGFTNISSAPVATELVLDLTATLSGGNDLQAHIYLFEEENFEFYGDSGTMLFESNSVLWPGFEPFTNNSGPEGFDISFKFFDGVVDEQRRFPFTVDPGDSFYVWANLIATADRSGQSNAGSTLTASFTNVVGLQPVAMDPGDIGKVPDGGTTLCLALIAGLGLRLMRRS
jgi:hypothetical protein